MFFNSAHAAVGDAGLRRPLLVGAGFGAARAPPSAPADMPARTYDAYLDFGLEPAGQRVLRRRVELPHRRLQRLLPVTTQSLRFMGKGMAVLQFSPSMTVKAGVWYLDRVTTKILPAGGICLDAQPRHLLRHPLPQPEDRQAADDLGQHRVVALRLGRLRRRHLDDQTQHGLLPPVPPDGTYTALRLRRHPHRRGLGVQDAPPDEGHFEVGFACDRAVELPRAVSPMSFYPDQHGVLGAGLTY